MLTLVIQTFKIYVDLGNPKLRKENRRDRTMTYRVTSKMDEELSNTYRNVTECHDVWTDNGSLAWQLVMDDGNTATFAKIDWSMEKLDWVELH